MNSFNSIVVRLKVANANIAEKFHNGFQFHSGSIKSARHGTKRRRIFWFQFHSGSIKSVYGITALYIKSKFQFHSGSIKSERYESIYVRPSAGFNSIVVRLKDVESKLDDGRGHCFNSIVVRLKGHPNRARGSGGFVSIP